jgi:peptidyl-prolyl cis-trans isomerase B (cyclophilin B)
LALFGFITGPGPVPSLDGQNVVFGTVLEGFETISAVVSQPTFKPNEKIQAFNQFASFIGDER